MRSSSLTTRILLPLIGIALLASAIVSWMSWTLGHRNAEFELRERYDSIKQTVAEANYPLTAPVIDSLAELTHADWITVDAGGAIVDTTLAGVSSEVIADVPYFEVGNDANRRESFPTLTIDEDIYIALRFRRQGVAGNIDRVASIIMLFEESVVASAANSAALPPLIAGISTIALLTIFMLAITSRLIARLRKLQSRVQRVAEGDFATSPVDRSDDEITHLAATINRMAVQLKSLWEQVNRQQGEKLLHQIAGGMAHQLRNTLTGARMAIELHREACAEPGEDVAVALRQLEIAEQYVHRLLTLGRQGSQHEEEEPEFVKVCLDDIRLTHESIAKHLHVQLSWQDEQLDPAASVSSGAMFTAAVSNLVLNAMQAGDSVQVTAQVNDVTCVVEVKDNGPGIAPEVEPTLFEPFITTRPEGMGLGLPLVKRAAGHLDGDVTWRREEPFTVFTFKCAVQREKTS